MRPILPAAPEARWSGLDDSWQEAFQCSAAIRLAPVAVVGTPAPRLTDLQVHEAFGYLWPQLRALREAAGGA